MRKLFYAALVALIAVMASNMDAAAASQKVKLATSAGDIVLELDGDKAPATVANFIAYVQAKHYDGTIFHRVIRGFMIQGGGFEPGLRQKATRAPIRNEADNGLKNVAGAIAMARTSDPDSASAQFFINTVDNPSLDHREKSARGWGYAVFGKVVQGMDVVKKIEAAPTGRSGRFDDVPATDIVILSAQVM